MLRVKRSLARPQSAIKDLTSQPAKARSAEHSTPIESEDTNFKEMIRQFYLFNALVCIFAIFLKTIHNTLWPSLLRAAECQSTADEACLAPLSRESGKSSQESALKLDTLSPPQPGECAETAGFAVVSFQK